eukprot:Phypoly_transcript_02200.p1 GENE.Phypoly_transcript_02200~~Phypoly_transcript_02200.p1  ORF type:complete len:905 (+),score=146.21 Phypoly_transcript_02200:115-2829(+)
MESSWIASQKKAFARWANHVLQQRGLSIQDIDHDLRNGHVLISLVEILEGAKVDVSPRKGQTSAPHGESKIQSFTNATRALKFIESHGISLVNCRAEHIVDNNSKMVLGLLWRVITHYHIQPLTEDEVVTDLGDGGSKYNTLDLKHGLEGNRSLRLKSLMNKSHRDTLLRWCKSELEPYGINPTNLTKSFQSPAALAALVHKQNPSIINLEEINSMEPAAAFAKIFQLAETHLGIPQILDPSDFIDVTGTDECSVMIYIAYFLKRTPAVNRVFNRVRSQAELNTYFKNPSDTTREDPSDELAAENAKLRAENHMLKEFIKNELEKIAKTMELNMQHTVQKVDAKTSLLSAKTQTLKISLEQVSAATASTIAENRRLRAEAKQNAVPTSASPTVSASPDAEELKSLRSELAQSKVELKEAVEKVAVLREEVDKKESKNAELKRSNDELQMENQTLQKQLHEIKATPTPTQNPSPKISPPPSPTPSFAPSPTLSPPVTRPESADGASQPANKLPVEPKNNAVASRGEENTPNVTTKGEPGTKAGLSAEDLKTHNIIVVQSLVRRWLAKRWAKRARRRQTVVSELITTERTYVGCLQTLLSEYFQPLRKMAAEGQPLSQTLNENLLKTIFNNAEVIYNINSNLLAKLEQRWNTWNYEQKLGDVFLSTMEFLKCYNQYVNHYNRSLDTLAECAKITAFMDFLKVKGLKCGHHLRDLLIVPVQRIPRYVILLEEMVRYTSKTHPDFKELTLALSKMHAIADYVNEKKRDFESLAQVSAIQETLVGISILEYPRLRFLQEGDLVFDGGKKTQTYHVFLFNEIVLLTKLQKKVFGDRKQKQLKYKFLELIKLSADTKVSKMDGSFSIEISNSPPKKFITTTEKERDLWASNIHSSVEKMIEAKRTKAVDRM